MLFIDLLQTICTLSIVIMTGIYFIFSNTILLALEKIEGGAYIMAKINEVILNVPFKIIFFISGVGTAYFTFLTDEVEVSYRVACAIFLVGTFIVTIFKNVPLNNYLKHNIAVKVDVENTWQHYLSAWGKWNNVRTLSALAAVTIIAVPN